MLWEMFCCCPTVSFLHIFLSKCKLSRYNRPLPYLFHILMGMFPYQSVPPQSPRLHLPPHVYFSMSLNYFESLWAFSSIIRPRWVSLCHIEIYRPPVYVTWVTFSEHSSNYRLHIGILSLNDPPTFPKDVLSCYLLIDFCNPLHIPWLETCLPGEARSKSHIMISYREGRSLVPLMHFHIISPFSNLF